MKITEAAEIYSQDTWINEINKELNILLKNTRHVKMLNIIINEALLA